MAFRTLVSPQLQGEARAYQWGSKGKERQDDMTPGVHSWKRERNVQAAQIAAPEKEIPSLKSCPRASHTSSLLDNDDPLPHPKYELPKVFTREYSPTYNLLNCAQHKCSEDVVGLALTHLGLDVQKCLDSKWKGTSPTD